MSDKKTDIQKQIENIDVELYNLLMKRTDLVKKNTNSVKIQNILGQEAMGIRRMLKHHTGDFPEYVVAKIWREILSVSASLNEKLKIAVYGDEKDTSLVYRVQEHFGSYVDVSILGSFSQVFNRLSTKEAQLAIIPCDNVKMNEYPWWSSMAKNDDKESLNIVAKLPFVRSKNIVADSEAFVIACSPSDASGIDNSLFSIETEINVSNSTISDAFARMEFDEAKILISTNYEDSKFTLVEVKGFVGTHDARLQEKPETFKSLHLSGTYARPIEV